MNYEELREEVKNLFAADEVKDGLELLYAKLKGMDHEKECIMLLSRMSQNDRAKSKGIITLREYEVQKRRIMFGALEFLDTLA